MLCLSCPLTDYCTDTTLLCVFFFSLSQMTEQRKNKQRLGFLGPPQVNHHVPTHWGAPDSAVAPPWPLSGRLTHTPSQTRSLWNNTCTEIRSEWNDRAFNKRRWLCHHWKLHLVSTLMWWAASHYLFHLCTPSYRQTALWMIDQTQHTSASVVLVCQTSWGIHFLFTSLKFLCGKNI